MSVADVSCDTSTTSSTTLSVCSGRSSIATSRCGALVALFLERDGADAAHPHERGLGRGEPDRQDEQHDDDREDRPVGSAHAVCSPWALSSSSCRKRSSSSRSRRCIDRGLAFLGVVVVQQVQHTVHDEQRELVVDGAGVRRRLAGRHRRAHHDVAEHDRRVDRLGRAARARARRCRDGGRSAGGRRRSGTTSTSVGPSPPRKRPLRSAMASSSTKISDTSASAGARSSTSTRRARRSQRGRSTSTVDCSSDAKTAIEVSRSPARTRSRCPARSCAGRRRGRRAPRTRGRGCRRGSRARRAGRCGRAPRAGRSG